ATAASAGSLTLPEMELFPLWAIVTAAVMANRIAFLPIVFTICIVSIILYSIEIMGLSGYCQAGSCARVVSMQRRTFLKTLPALSASTAAAVSSASDEDPPVPVKLGFDTYSLRAFQWKGVRLLEYAANLKLDTIQFSSLEDYGGLDAANLQKVKDAAARLGIAIDSGMGCICESSKSFNKKGRPAREQLLEG